MRRIPALEASNIRAVGGRQYVKKRQRFLADVIVAAYSGTRRHETEPNAFSLSRAEWTDGLSATRDRYKKLLEPLFLFESGNRGYDADKGQTKAYWLRPDTFDGTRDVMEGKEAFPIRCGETGELVEADSLPSNGLPEEAALPFTIPAILPLAVENVDRAIETVERWNRIHGPGGWSPPLDPEKPDKTTIDEGLKLLRVCRMWARSLGGILNGYTLQGNGRLCPENGLAPHVITLPSMIRRLLFASSGLVDYDLRAAFWSIFVSCGAAYGFPTDHARNYLANRAEWHSHFQHITKKRHSGPIKETLLSWLAGAPLSSSPKTTAFRLFGAEGSFNLSQDSRAQALHGEARRGLKAILKETPRVRSNGYDVPVNAVGLPLSKEDKPTFAQEASHVLTGFEQYAIRCICSQVHGLQGLVYDGYLAPCHDTKTLEQHVTRQSEIELGIPIQVTLKTTPFSTPIPDPESSDF